MEDWTILIDKLYKTLSEGNNGAKFYYYVSGLSINSRVLNYSEENNVLIDITFRGGEVRPVSFTEHIEKLPLCTRYQYRLYDKNKNWIGSILINEIN